MAHTAIVVFTARNLRWILADGGSQAWRLDPDRARRTDYLVCTQNRHNTGFGDPAAPHGAAFLLGRISDVVRSPERSDRWLIKIQDYCPLPNIQNVWGGWRYPLRYATLEELGIDPARFSFQPLPPRPAEGRGSARDTVGPAGVHRAPAPQGPGFGQAMRALFEPLGGLDLPPPLRQPAPEPPDFADRGTSGSSAAA